jgi:hypothetical protein
MASQGKQPIQKPDAENPGPVGTAGDQTGGPARLSGLPGAGGGGATGGAGAPGGTGAITDLMGGTTLGGRPGDETEGAEDDQADDEA